MKYWTKKYWLGTLTILCALLFAGCSTSTTSQETTAEKSITLDGTWEMTDVKTTLRKSFVLRGSDPIKYAYAIDDLED